MSGVWALLVASLLAGGPSMVRACSRAFDAWTTHCQHARRWHVRMALEHWRLGWPWMILATFAIAALIMDPAIPVDQCVHVAVDAVKAHGG